MPSSASGLSTTASQGCFGLVGVAAPSDGALVRGLADVGLSLGEA
jgi:hypothetical protein